VGSLKRSKDMEKKNEKKIDIKPYTDIEYLEYLSRKAKTINNITYPDGSKGEITKGIMLI